VDAVDHIYIPIIGGGYIRKNRAEITFRRYINGVVVEIKNKRNSIHHKHNNNIIIHTVLR
jgi:hypothetical protein